MVSSVNVGNNWVVVRSTGSEQYVKKRASYARGGSLVVALFIWECWEQFDFAARRGEIRFLLCQWLITMSVVCSAFLWWRRK